MSGTNVEAAKKESASSLKKASNSSVNKKESQEKAQTDAEAKPGSSSNAAPETQGEAAAPAAAEPDASGPPPLPEGWEEKTSRSTGKTYYVNTYTKESMWERPTEPAQPSSEQVPSC
ncbi:hypothetical protein EB796_013403 [Bugula neritina]|uniref:WW domain-containing protein n=1 Tax=Bugula neritina TaxID=10212 RepID=A0A7J7JPN5_BUGNE|nr:hypothetical protein EB796_013403 [Bugula neritina]